MKTGTNTKYDKLVSEGSILTEYLPYRSKQAREFEWAEKCADYIGTLYSPLRDEERLRNLKINYDIANGRGDILLNNTAQFDVQKIEGEIISSGSYPIRHVPVINQIYNGMIGEQMQASLKFTAVDSSGYSTNMRQKKRLELNQQWIQDNIIGPIEQQIAMQVMIENGVTDQSKLSPDQQQDLFADIQNRTKFRLIEDIDKFMARDYKTPVETQVQRLVNWLVNECDIKYITDENFKNVIITGSEIYRIFIRNNLPKVEIVNPVGFWNHSSKNKLFIDESDIIAYRQGITFADIMNWHGTELFKSKYKDKLSVIKQNDILNRVVGSPFGSLVLKVAPPINTEEGQRYAKVLNTIFGDTNNGDINYTHHVWKSFGKQKAIKRKTKQGVQLFYVDEHYEFNPMKGDIEENIEIVPELYQCTKIGSDIYVDKGPLPYQYRSRQNPFEVRMNYVGANYNTFGGNSNNVAPLDLGKPWQHKINIQMAKIEEIDRKSHGSILLFLKAAKPRNTTWREWFNLIKNEGIAITEGQSEGLTANDLQAIRSIETAQLKELAERLQYVEFLRNQMAMSMGFNPSRLGIQNPDMSVTNNRQNIVQSTIQTEYLYRTHNKVVENLMNNLVNVAKIALKDNPVKTTYVLDDMSIAEFELDHDLLDIAEQNIFVNNSIEDQKNINDLNMLAQPLIQNGQIDFEDASKMKFSKNGADILNIAHEAIRKNDARMQQKYEMDQQLMQQQAQMAQQLEQMRHQMAMEKQERELQMKLLAVEIDSYKFANQWDIDASGMSDQRETNQDNLRFQREKLDKETQLRDKELNQNKEIKLKEIEAKIKAIRAKPKK